MQTVKQLRQWVVNRLDVLQRYLSNDQYSHLSRSQLINCLEETNVHLLELQTRREHDGENIAREIIRLLDDLCEIVRGDISIRTNAHADVTGAISDTLNVFLDDLCKLIAELPEDSPLRQKYRLPKKFLHKKNT